jgi:hypothetical protein
MSLKYFITYRIFLIGLFNKYINIVIVNKSDKVSVENDVKTLLYLNTNIILKNIPVVSTNND